MKRRILKPNAASLNANRDLPAANTLFRKINLSPENPSFGIHHVQRKLDCGFIAKFSLHNLIKLGNQIKQARKFLVSRLDQLILGR